jgi:hypothetical protein
MNVLVIPEDFRKDQYVLKPVVEALMSAIGKTNAKVKVCTDPLIGGVVRALEWDVLTDIIDRYKGMIHLFLLIVDRDGDANRRAALDALERRACTALGKGRCFLAEAAIEEVEVWALAGTELPKGVTWKQIREHPHPKESFFEPVARTRGLLDEPGEGRKTFGAEAGQNYAKKVRQRCPEDIGRLEARVSTYITTGTCPPCTR